MHINYEKRFKKLLLLLLLLLLLSLLCNLTWQDYNRSAIGNILCHTEKDKENKRKPCWEVHYSYILLFLIYNIDY